MKLPMNVAMTWFQMCIERGRYSEGELLIENKRVLERPEIKRALCILNGRGKQRILSDQKSLKWESTVKSEK